MGDWEDGGVQTWLYRSYSDLQIQRRLETREGFAMVDMMCVRVKVMCEGAKSYLDT